MREIVPDLALERLVEDQRTAGDARHELDGAVVVRRAETARDEAADRLREALCECRFEILDPVADDRDAHGVEAEPDSLGGEERPVAVLPLAANELASPSTTIAARGRLKRWPG